MWNADPGRLDQPDYLERIIQITGTGATDPTLNIGQSCTVKWISTGLYEITWKEYPGKFRFFAEEGWQATTASALKGYTAVAGAYDSTAFKLRFSVTNASDTLADLQVLQVFSCGVFFSLQSVNAPG
jgi:hypothetical protein